MSERVRWNSHRRWNNPLTWLGKARIYAPPRAAPTRVLVEVESDEGSHWFSDGHYVDASAGVVADPRLVGAVRFQRKASTPFWSGSRSQVGIGAVELANADGRLLPLLASGLNNRIVRLWLGTEATPLSAMTPVARCIVIAPDSLGSTVRLLLADGTAEFDVPIYTGTLPSGANAGQAIGMSWGQAFSVPVVQVDPPNLVFALDADGPPLIGAVRDGGVWLDAGTQWIADDAPPVFWGIELQQSVARQITADVVGQGFGGGGLAAMLTWALGTRLGLPGSRLDTAGYSALQSELSGGSGSYTYGRHFKTGLWSQAFDRLAASFGGWWTVDPLGVVRFARLRVPTGSAPVLTIDRRMLRNGQFSIEFDEAPGLKTAVLIAPNSTQVTNLAGSVAGTPEGALLSRGFRGRHPFLVHNAYQRAADLTSAEDGMETMIAEDTGAVEAARRSALYGDPRYFWRLPVYMDAVTALTLPLGAEVTFDFPPFANNHPLIVSGVEGELAANRFDLVCWGSGPALEA